MAEVDGGPIAQAAVEIIADFDRFSDDVKAKLRAAAAAAGKDFDKTLKDGTSRTGRDVGERVADGAGRKSGERAGISWGDAFRQAIAFRITHQALRTIFAPLVAIGATLGIATLGAGAAAATASLVKFLAVASQASGIVLALPSALAIGAAGFIALRVAVIGVGDAFEAALSGDPEKFAEALKALSPAARAVATEFRDLVPELKAIKDAVQEAFFGPLQGQLTQTAAVLAGPFRAGMVAVAGAAGQVSVGLGEIARQSATVQLVTAAFDTTRASIDNLRPGLLAIVTGFRDLALVALPIFQQMSGSLGGLATQFGEWLSQISASGQAFAWIQNALVVLRQLGDVVLQLGGIIGAVFRAAQTAGSSVIQTFADLLRGANAFLSSTQGQDALISIFASLKSVAGALQPVLKEIFVQLGQFAPSAAQIAVALGPGLTSIVQILGQALKGLGPGLAAISRGLSEGLVKAGPGLVKLGEAIGRLFEALAPILPLLGELVGVLAGVLADALDALIPALIPVVEALVEGLAPILPQIAEAFTVLVTALAPILPLLGELLAFAIQLAAAGLQIVFQVIAVAAQVLAAAINGLVAAATWLWNNVLQPLGAFLGGVFTVALTIVEIAIGLVAAAILGWVQIATWLWNNVLAPFGNFLSSVFRPVIDAVRVVLDGIGVRFSAIGVAASWLWNNVLAPFGNFLSSVFRPVIDAVAGAFRAIGTAIQAVISAVRSLIGWVEDAIDGLFDLIGLGNSTTSIGVLPIPRSGPRSAPGPGPRSAPTPRGGFPVPRSMLPTRTPISRAPRFAPAVRPPLVVGGVTKNTVVNAPITVVSRAADPLIVARRASDRLAALAQT